MSPAGGGKPLFELVTNGRRAETDAAPPAGRGDEPSDPPRPEDDPHRGLTGEVRVRVGWLYIAGATVLVLLVVLYGLGYRLGVSAEQSRRRAQASREARQVFVDDPLTRSDRATPPPLPAQPGGTGVSDPAGMILTAQGPVSSDPRIEGNNYLELATLSREAAELAVRYLDGHGIEAIAVPVSGVDRRGRGSNTSARYRIVSVDLAVPSDRYSALSRERERLEKRVKRAGRAWSEAGGASDFSDPLWRRYGG